MQIEPQCKVVEMLVLDETVGTSHVILSAQLLSGKGRKNSWSKSVIGLHVHKVPANNLAPCTAYAPIECRKSAMAFFFIKITRRDIIYEKSSLSNANIS